MGIDIQIDGAFLTGAAGLVTAIGAVAANWRANRRHRQERRAEKLELERKIDAQRQRLGAVEEFAERTGSFKVTVKGGD